MTRLILTILKYIWPGECPQVKYSELQTSPPFVLPGLHQTLRTTPLHPKQTMFIIIFSKLHILGIFQCFHKPSTKENIEYLKSELISYYYYYYYYFEWLSCWTCHETYFFEVQFELNTVNNRRTNFNKYEVKGKSYRVENMTNNWNMEWRVNTNLIWGLSKSNQIGLEHRKRNPNGLSPPTCWPSPAILFLRNFLSEDRGKDRICFTNTLVIYWVTDWVLHF